MLPAALASLRQTQLWRIERLVHWLREAQPFTRRTAAREFQVSVRTIADDIERLKYLGVPVDYDARRGAYYLTEPFDHLPFVSIRRREWAAFLVACFALDALGETFDGTHLRALVERLSMQLPPEVQVPPDTLSRTLQIDRATRPLHPARFLEPLRLAAEARQVIALQYRGNNRDQETQREVEPYRLLFRDGFWYLIAYCRLRRELRSFRVDRVRGMQKTDEIFPREQDPDLDGYLNATFGMHWDDRKYSVCIRFSAYQARWIREVEWRPTQRIVEHGDGSLDLHMETTGLVDVTRWVLSYGAEAEVLSPTVLRDSVAAEARRMAALYAAEANEARRPSSSLP